MGVRSSTRPALFRYANSTFPVTVRCGEGGTASVWTADTPHRDRPWGLDACFKGRCAATPRCARRPLYRAMAISHSTICRARRTLPVSAAARLRPGRLPPRRQWRAFSPKGAAHRCAIWRCRRICSTAAGHAGRLYLRREHTRCCARPGHRRIEAHQRHLLRLRPRRETCCSRQGTCNDDIFAGVASSAAGEAYNLRSGMWATRAPGRNRSFAANNPASTPRAAL